MFVFAYGSLLLPESLRRTLPNIDIDKCIAATCSGATRVFGVAFPNDGSQPDKAYFDPAGHRPPFVLFADLKAASGTAANGICLPMSESALQQLQRRELRYQLEDVTSRIAAYPGQPEIDEPVLAFLGKAEFTDPADCEAGVVPSAYLNMTIDGARFWDGRAAGFLADFETSTQLPATDRVVELTRIDY